MRRALTLQALQSLPKVELHCHLDGSVPVPVFAELARRGVPGVPQSREALLARIRAPQPCRDLAQYLEAFSLTLRLLRDMEVLWEATRALAGQLKQENVVYAELRFAPLTLASERAGADVVVRTVLDAMAVAQREHGVVLRAILCMMRHVDEEQNLRVLDLAHKYRGRGVAGVDLAGDEAAWPARLYAGLFQRAAGMDLPYTIHAGECGSAGNVSACVEMGARRIGHGIAAIRDEGLCRRIAGEGVFLEICPVSNLQTGAVAAWEEHPLVSFAKRGVPVCISTDNRTVSDTTLTREFSELAARFAAVDADFLKARTLQALEGAFLSPSEKTPLRAAVEAGYGGCLSRGSGTKRLSCNVEIPSAYWGRRTGCFTRWRCL